DSALTRTLISQPRDGRFASIDLSFCRAASFSRGATESSRSTTTASQASVAILASALSFTAGTYRTERRGRGGLSAIRSSCPAKPVVARACGKAAKPVFCPDRQVRPSSLGKNDMAQYDIVIIGGAIV